MLPEAPEGSSASRRIRKPPQSFPRHAVLTGACSRRENHRAAQTPDIRNMNSLSISIGSFAAVRPPSRAKSRSARHSRYNLAVQFDAHQRAKRRNPPGKLLRAVDRIDNHPRSPRSTRRLRVPAAHLLPQYVQSQPARRHFCPRHFFHAAVRLRHCCAVSLPIDSQFIGAEIPHRNGIRLLRDRLQ